MSTTVRLLQTGAAKPANNPYTICLVANPYLEAPYESGLFKPDPIMASEPQFDACVAFILDCLFGRLPGQREQMLASLATDIRVISLFDSSLPEQDRYSLVGEDPDSDLVIPRIGYFRNFLQPYSASGIDSLSADVCFAVTASATHSRCSAWFTNDLATGGGKPFSIDASTFTHSYTNLEPGQVALHVAADTVVPLHEFGHAASSFTNGKVVDQYVDGVTGINNKKGRPIPSVFARYNGIAYGADLGRAGVGYPSAWTSYHPALSNPLFPSLMDDFYRSSSGNPEDCEFDRLTRQFLLDRIRAIMSRP